MSCGIIFLSDNLASQSNISLTTGSENSQFPLNNIKNEATAVKFRSQENDVVIVFDLQQTRTIDTIALHGDTNDTLGLTTASFKTSLTTDFSGSTATNIPLSAADIMGYVLLDASVSHRYVELTLSGTGSYVELSNIFIGEKIEIEQNNLSIESFRYGYRDNSTTSNNDYDQLFINKRNNTKFVSGALQFCTKSEQETLDNMFIKHQRSESIWMIVDKESAGINDGKYKLTVYGYFQDVPLWSASGGQHYSCNVRVNQAG
jgi:hypothetical protein